MIFKNYSQLFIEFEAGSLHIDIHLEKFNKRNLNSILNNYINKYRGKDVNMLFLRFWERSIAGDYLSLLRKNNADLSLHRPLNGFKYIKAAYDYINTNTEVGKVSVIN